MTLKELLYKSLRITNVTASGEVPSADELTDALQTFNTMLDSWSADSLSVYRKTRETFNLVAGQQSYTLLSGGDFDSSGNAQVNYAGTLISNIEYPLQKVETKQWSEITSRQLYNNIPDTFYVTNQGTVTGDATGFTISFSPTPNSNHQVALYLNKDLQKLTSSQYETDLSLPSGYEQALIYNLSVELHIEYGRQPNPVVIKIANDSKAQIMRSNFESVKLNSDAPLVSKGLYNIYKGST